jgi:hypothetical protein
MASKIEISSNAMILIGASPISSFTEGTEGLVANALYETTYTALLSSFRWRFASKQALLSRLVATPLNSYQYQYQLPTDLLVIIKTEYLDRYEIFGDKLYSDSPSLEIDYIYRVDETLLPAYFVKTLEFSLAAQFAIPITNNSQRAAVWSNAYETQLRMAKNTDSTQRPSSAIVDSPLTGIQQ